jgi:hypothetical protein
MSNELRTTLLPIVKVEQDMYRVILPRRNATEILLIANGSRFMLPAVDIPQRHRVAKTLTEEFTTRWGLRAYCLFTMSLSTELTERGRVFYQVMAPSSLDQEHPVTACWVPTTSLSKDSFEHADDFEALVQALRELSAYDKGLKQGPFGRVGWLRDLFDWAQEQINPLGLRLSGKCHQFNASPTFSLIRLETTGPALWFKAVGEPNLHEYSITLGLAQDHAHYLPKIVAIKPDWNGWLMLEAEREDFDDGRELEQWQRVTETFAHLQLEYVGKTQRLLEIGCKDRRLATIIQRIDLFIDIMSELMQQQPSEPPSRLSHLELEILRSKLKTSCYRMQSSGIPDSLLHGDFNPGNIRANAKHCIFLDWAEGCLGPPFLTLEYLIAHLHRINPRSDEYDQYLRRTYANCWSAVASKKQIYEAMKMSPSIAVFYHAFSSAVGRDPKVLQESRVAKYLRSLTRRLHKELEQFEQREVCSA